MSTAPHSTPAKRLLRKFTGPGQTAPHYVAFGVGDLVGEKNNSEHPNHGPCPRSQKQIPENTQACQSPTVEDAISKVTFSWRISILIFRRFRPRTGRGPERENLSVLSARDGILQTKADEAESHPPYL